MEIGNDDNNIGGSQSQRFLVVDDQRRMENLNTPKITLINIDKQKVAQVVRNLLSNALKFTPKGGRITVKATVIRVAPISRTADVITTAIANTSLSPPYLRFEVTDTGPGISAVGLFYLVKAAYIRPYQAADTDCSPRALTLFKIKITRFLSIVRRRTVATIHTNVMLRNYAIFPFSCCMSPV